MSLLDADDHIINTLYEIKELNRAATQLLEGYQSDHASTKLRTAHHYAIQLRAQSRYKTDKLLLYICKNYMYKSTIAAEYIMKLTADI